MRKKKIAAALLCVLLLMGCSKETTFGGTTDRLIAALRTDLTANGYAEWFSEDAETTEAAVDEGKPKALYRSYTAPGMTFNVFSLKENDEVYEAELTIQKEQLLAGHEKEIIDMMLDLFTDAFERRKRDELYDTLSLTEAAEESEADKNATGTLAEWAYFIKDGVLTIRATALGYLEAYGDEDKAA